MVVISETAARKIEALKAESLQDVTQMHQSFLRVKITPGGCSGMSYKLDFDQKLAETDKVFEAHGTRVVVDSKSYLYVAGMTLDYEGGLNGKGFIFANPNASKTCGCGSSFGV